MNEQDVQHDERRRQPRFPFHRSATVLDDTREYPGTLLDVSFSGALFESEVSAPPATLRDSTLVIAFGRDPEEAIRLRARIAYRSRLRLGLHWGQIDPESAMKLQRLVEMNLGSPSLLKRPLLKLIWPPANPVATPRPHRGPSTEP